MQLDRLEQLDRLIAAGWGYHPGKKIPRAVERAAANPRAIVPQADAGEARRYERRYHDAAGEIALPPTKTVRKCVICGAEHLRASAAKTCSRECGEKLRLRTLERIRAEQVIPPSERRCVQCGGVFVGHSQFDLCSDECRRKRRLAHSRNEVRVRSEMRQKEREKYASNHHKMLDLAGKSSTKTLEYRQEDLHVG